MTSIKKQIHYCFNRLRYKFRWFVRKWTHGDCRHVCRFCKWHDECAMDIMVIVGGPKAVRKIFHSGDTHGVHFK